MDKAKYIFLQKLLVNRGWTIPQEKTDRRWLKPKPTTDRSSILVNTQ